MNSRISCIVLEDFLARQESPSADPVVEGDKNHGLPHFHGVVYYVLSIVYWKGAVSACKPAPIDVLA